MAVQVYQATHEMMPSVTGAAIWPRSLKHYSVFTQIMPYIEGGDIYNHINFDTDIYDFYMNRINDELYGCEANRTVMSTQLSIFICPEDGSSGRRGWTGRTNYRANLGTERWGSRQDWNAAGPFSGISYVSTAATTDGLSNTVAFSEKLCGRSRSLDPRTDMIVGGLGQPYSVDEAVAHCSAGSGLSVTYYSTAGLSWFVGALSHTTYNQIITPNNSKHDCIIGSIPISGIIGARSDHGGGVSVGMADGSVRFVSDGIYESAWRAIGTRSGGEFESDY